MLTLIGSSTSPFVRKLRLLIIDKKIECEIKTINYLEENDAEFLKKINPINKIPILMIDDQPLYDSRIIYNYLAQKINLPKLTIIEENILSAIDGALDTSINLFMLRRGGMDLSLKNSFIERQNARIPLIFNFLSPWVKQLDANNTKDWNILTMSLYSYLYWGQFREILDLTHYPEMKKFLEEFKDKNGILETSIPT